MLPVFENIILFDELDSTNKYLKENHKLYENGSVIIAQNQTAGKGRYERVWEGKKGSSIFASFLIKDIKNPLDGIRSTFLFSLAVGNFLEKHIKNIRILQYKWPNDILISGKKISGILSEFSGTSLIVGVGINIFKFNHSSDIETKIEYLENLSDKKETISYYQRSFVDSVNTVIKNFKEENLKKIPYIWFEKSNIKNRSILVTDNDGSKIEGIVEGIEDSGTLILRVGTIIKKVHTGDMFYNDKF